MQRGFSRGSESEAQLRRISGEIEMLELGERERENGGKVTVFMRGSDGNR